MNQKSDRRQFLKGVVGGLGGILAARLSGIFPEIHPLFAKTTHESIPSQRPTSSSNIEDIGELYSGFVLLSEGMPIPNYVKASKFGVPVVCGIGANEGGAVATAVTEFYSNVADLKKVIDLPVYTLDPFPDGFQPLGAMALKHQTGEIFAISIDFQTYNEKTDGLETTVSIWAYPDFPQPFPLWSAEPLEANGASITLEKVDFLPMPGILVATAMGYVCHWIADGILYCLIAENSTLNSNIHSIVNKLTLH